jgi:preprotein translocase subunit SecF
MFIIKNRAYIYAFTILLVLGSLAAVSLFGLNLGIDFKGGTLSEVRYAAGRPAVTAVEATLAQAGITGVQVRPQGTDAYSIRTTALAPEKRAAFEVTLRSTGASSSIERMSEVGPTVGEELRKKALIAIVLVIFAIVSYIALVFRRVSKPVSSWVYGGIAVVALVHDVIIPTGALAVLAHFTGVQADALFVTALLAILGYSVSDTIVVFDRVRENLRTNNSAHKKEEFETTVGHSLEQTIVRSINVSLTALISLTALYMFGPASTEAFALILIVGVIAGTFSSIFLASPLLVTIANWQRKVK